MKCRVPNRKKNWLLNLKTSPPKKRKLGKEMVISVRGRGTGAFLRETRGLARNLKGKDTARRCTYYYETRKKERFRGREGSSWKDHGGTTRKFYGLGHPRFKKRSRKEIS